MRLGREEIVNIKNIVKDKKIGVIGDGCLDIYWKADMTLSKLSRETPHYPLPVVDEKFYLGAASNVVNNLFTLGADIEFLTIVGNDWRGREFKRIIDEMGINSEYIISAPNSLTPAYCKPLRSGISEVVYEDPRLDFENHAPINEELEALVIEKLIQMSKNIDVLIVSDQFYYGVITDKVIETLFELEKEGLKIVVDSRENVAKYKGLFIKPNEVEVYEILGEEVDYGPVDVEKFIGLAKKLREINNNHDMIVTLGSLGAILIEEESATHIPTVPATGELDVVGCGDAFTSGFALGLSMGFTEKKSVEFANLVSGIVIKKIGITGSATLEEVLEKYDEVK